MIGICSRCKRENRYEYVTKKLCHSCVVSLGAHKRALLGTISDEEREKKKLYHKKYYKKDKRETKEKRKEYMQRAYQKDKEKWDVRSKTRMIMALHTLKKETKNCQVCNKEKKLEFHHSTYDYDKIKANPKDCVEILCIDCHRKKHRLSEKNKEVR